MRGAFLLMFSLTTLSGALAYGSARAARAGGGTPALALLVLFAVPAVVGFVVLVRMVYLDGRSARGRVEAARELRRLR
jgi:hypothetical protein